MTYKNFLYILLLNINYHILYCNDLFPSNLIGLIDVNDVENIHNEIQKAKKKKIFYQKQKRKRLQKKRKKEIKQNSFFNKAKEKIKITINIIIGFKNNIVLKALKGYLIKGIGIIIFLIMVYKYIFKQVNGKQELNNLFKKDNTNVKNKKLIIKLDQEVADKLPTIDPMEMIQELLNPNKDWTQGITDIENLKDKMEQDQEKNDYLFIKNLVAMINNEDNQIQEYKSFLFLSKIKLNHNFINLYKKNLNDYLKNTNLKVLEFIIFYSMTQNLIMVQMNNYYKKHFLYKSMKSYLDIDKSFNEDFNICYRLERRINKFIEKADDNLMDKTLKNIFNTLEDQISTDTHHIIQSLQLNDKIKNNIINNLKKYNVNTKYITDNDLLKNFIIKISREIGCGLFNKTLYEIENRIS